MRIRFNEWRAWYKERMPTAIDDATEKVYAMVRLLKTAIEAVDRPMVKKWIEDLLLIKTFTGLRFQESILKRVSVMRHAQYRTATPQEESQGIDGMIGGKPVSIKPTTYKTKAMLHEDIKVEIIYYEKEKNFLRVHAT